MFKTQQNFSTSMIVTTEWFVWNFNQWLNCFQQWVIYSPNAYLTTAKTSNSDYEITCKIRITGVTCLACFHLLCIHNYLAPRRTLLEKLLVAQLVFYGSRRFIILSLSWALQFQTTPLHSTLLGSISIVTYLRPVSKVALLVFGLKYLQRIQAISEFLKLNLRIPECYKVCLRIPSKEFV